MGDFFSLDDRNSKICSFFFSCEFLRGHFDSVGIIRAQQYNMLFDMEIA